MSDDFAVSPEDALKVAQQAIDRVDGLEDRVEKIEDLEDRVTQLELRLSERDENRPYESLSIDEKVEMVREHGFKKATDLHGRARLDYKAIKYEVFDGKPGNNHCYKLIRLAAGLTDTDEDRPTGSEFPGFKARDPDGDNYHLAVDAEAAKRSGAYYSRNKATEEEVA